MLIACERMTGKQKEENAVARHHATKTLAAASGKPSNTNFIIFYLFIFSLNSAGRSTDAGQW